MNDIPELAADEVSVRRRTANPDNIVSGVGHGAKSFGLGIWDGVTGVVTAPYKGAKKEGAKGFGKGLGKGLLGLVTKPASGVVGLIGHTVQGAANTPGTIKRMTEEKKE